jgi:hypothetical protein
VDFEKVEGFNRELAREIREKDRLLREMKDPNFVPLGKLVSKSKLI